MQDLLADLCQYNIKKQKQKKLLICIRNQLANKINFRFYFLYLFFSCLPEIELHNCS